jgi:hypothetical protein
MMTMAKKRTALERAKVANGNAVEMVALPDEAPSRTIARRLLDPATTAGNTLHRLYRGVSEGNVNGYIAELQQQASAANAGDLSRPEATLTAQTQTLDALFHVLTGWALNNATGENANAAYFETCMRLALKAQSQSRATVETLAAIKNPPVVYARQANFASGHQQVNNNGDASRIREIRSPQTKLLEAEHGQRLDTGAPSATGRANQALETVGAVNGAANARG